MTKICVDLHVQERYRRIGSCNFTGLFQQVPTNLSMSSNCKKSVKGLLIKSVATYRMSRLAATSTFLAV